MIIHPKESSVVIAMRLVNNKWEFWDSRGYWSPDMNTHGPTSDNIVLSYEDTWCEPFKGMEDD